MRAPVRSNSRAALFWLLQPATSSSLRAAPARTPPKPGTVRSTRPASLDRTRPQRRSAGAPRWWFEELRRVAIDTERPSLVGPPRRPARIRTRLPPPRARAAARRSQCKQACDRGGVRAHKQQSVGQCSGEYVVAQAIHWPSTRFRCQCIANCNGQQRRFAQTGGYGSAPPTRQSESGRSMVSRAR
jgi:hypothetical protein